MNAPRLAARTRDPERSTRVRVHVRGLPATARTVRVATGDPVAACQIAAGLTARAYGVTRDRIVTEVVPTLRVVG